MMMMDGALRAVIGQEFHNGSNILIREMSFERAGDFVDGHAHAFDHTTYVVRGTLQIDILADDGKVLQSAKKHAGESKAWFLIRANTKHRLVALEARTLAHCIYAHRTPQGEVVQQYTGWEDSYV